MEEAAAHVHMGKLYTIFNLPHINQVYMMFLATLVDGQFGVGEESLETRLFDESEIPWNELAFPTINRTLKHYFADREKGTFTLRMEDITGFKRSKPAQP